LNLKYNQLFLNLVAIATLPLFFGCSKHYYKSNKMQNIEGVNNNVCKKLIGKVTVYAIFVDTYTTHPWTAYDIQSTTDSIQKAMDWIETQATLNGMDVSIDLLVHQKDKVIPLQQNLPEATLQESLFLPKLTEGISNLNDWANSIARKAAASFFPDTSSVVKTKNNITNRERLIARLRNMTQTDNVVIMYFLNSYYIDDYSLALYTGSRSETEFAIVTFKSPTVIAHEFLHIFGAPDLYLSPFDKKRKALRRKVAILKQYPDEIMAFTERPIEKLNLSVLTKYLIGWIPELSKEEKNRAFGKKMKIYKY
jgi:hypothetical protein